MRIIEIQNVRINMDAVSSYKLVTFLPDYSGKNVKAKVRLNFMGGNTEIFDFEELSYAEDTLHYIDEQLGYKQSAQ